MSKLEKGIELAGRILTKYLDKIPKRIKSQMSEELKAIINAVAEVMAEELENIDKKNAEFRKRLE